jgi:hypothetical protein
MCMPPTRELSALHFTACGAHWPGSTKLEHRPCPPKAMPKPNLIRVQAPVLVSGEHLMPTPPGAACGNSHVQCALLCQALSSLLRCISIASSSRRLLQHLRRILMISIADGVISVAVPLLHSCWKVACARVWIANVLDVVD